MQVTKELSELYDAYLASPGLEDSVKIDIRMTRSHALLLVLAVEQAISGSDAGNIFRKIVPEEDKTGVISITQELLKKAKLEVYHQKLKKFGL